MTTIQTKKQSADDMPPQVRSFGKVVAGPVLFIVDNIEIDEELPYAVNEAISGRYFERLSVCLVSHGGSALAAFKAATAIRRHVAPGGLTFYVPANCESAASLMCLAADQIVMGEVAALSALDVQVVEAMEDGTTGMRSSLAMREGFNVISDIAVEWQGKIANNITKHMNLADVEIVRQANNLVGNLLAPIMGAIDIEVVGERSRSRQLARQLGRRLLDMAGVVPEEKRFELLDRMIYSYDTHGFALMREELSEIGLPVVAADPELAQALEGLTFLHEFTEDRLLRLDDFTPSSNQKSA
jgi:hypothetical protein